ncbi:MAG: TonB-dependent receptor [Ginsengibacter sp.]
MKKGIFIAAAVMFSSYVQAQKDTAKTLDEIIVTANKFPQKQSETGKVIIVIDKATLEKSEGKTVAQILNEQAGLVVNGSLNNLGTNQTVYMRGAGSGRTLITIDGVPVNDPSLIDNSFDLNLISVDNIERIEICKGAQSTLYGSDAIAGVINIITVDPNITKPVNVKATLAGGSYDTYRYNLQLFGKLANKLAYNIRYTHLNSGGFSSAYDSTGKMNFDKDGYHNDALTGNVAWDVSHQFTLKGFAQYSYYKTGLDASAFTDAKDYNSTNKNLMFGTGFIYKISGTTITGNYYYNTSKRNLLEDSVFGQYYYNDQYNGKSHYAELLANSKLGKGFTWLNGADYHYSSMNELSNYGKFDDTSVNQKSIFSSLFYSGKSGFNAELGGRFNHHSRYGNNFTYTISPSFVFNNKWKIYTSVSSGFKAPSLYQLYSAYGDPNLKAEKSTSYEGGFQFDNAVANSRVTYFYRKISGGLDYDYVKNVYFNFDKEEDQGIEWENKIRISKTFSVSANYTLLKAKEETQSRTAYAFDPTTYAYSFNPDTTYHYSLRKPTSTINVALNIQPTKNWVLNISAHYESKRYDAVYATSDVSLKSFAIFNAYTEYNLDKKIKLFIDAKNITNKKFFTIYGYNSIPAEFMAGVVLKL